KEVWTLPGGGRLNLSCKIPVTGRTFYDSVEILLEHVAAADQVLRCRANALEVVLAPLVSRLEGRPRIVVHFPDPAGGSEWDVGAERLIDVTGIADGLATEVPAGRRGQRHRHFRIVDPSDVITVIVNMRHQKREGNQLVLEQPARSHDAAWIRHAGKLRELHGLHANQRVILKTRVSAGRR